MLVRFSGMRWLLVIGGMAGVAAECGVCAEITRASYQDGSGAECDPPRRPSFLAFLTARPLSQRRTLCRTRRLFSKRLANQPPNTATGLAARIVSEQLDAKQRVKMVRQLGRLNCAIYPDTPAELADTLLEDPAEIVRYEAVRALRRQLASYRRSSRRIVRRGDPYPDCCDPEIVNVLYVVAYCDDMGGFPIESSPRIRLAASRALRRCGDYEPAGEASASAPASLPLPAPPAESGLSPDAVPGPVDAPNGQGGVHPDAPPEEETPAPFVN